MTSKEHYNLNKEKYRAKNREWIEANRERVNAAARRRYRLKCERTWEHWDKERLNKMKNEIPKTI